MAKAYDDFIYIRLQNVAKIHSVIYNECKRYQEKNMLECLCSPLIELA